MKNYLDTDTRDKLHFVICGIRRHVYAIERIKIRNSKITSQHLKMDNWKWLAELNASLNEDLDKLKSLI